MATLRNQFSSLIQEAIRLCSHDRNFFCKAQVTFPSAFFVRRWSWFDVPCYCIRCLLFLHLPNELGKFGFIDVFFMLEGFWYGCWTVTWNLHRRDRSGIFCSNCGFVCRQYIWLSISHREDIGLCSGSCITFHFRQVSARGFLCCAV